MTTKKHHFWFSLTVVKRKGMAGTTNSRGGASQHLRYSMYVLQ